LRIRSGAQRPEAVTGDPVKRLGLVESGVVVINPPFSLQEDLQAAMPQMVQLMGQDNQAGFTLTTS
ncbi:MAG: rRNA ((2030)-N(6))-methyltransferase RlmJ, partial [Pseudomonadota bacterium]